jgi:hypothetical protein
MFFQGYDGHCAWTDGESETTATAIRATPNVFWYLLGM